MATLTKEEYIQNNYGTCDAPKCFCRTIGWIGTACHHWHPIDDKYMQMMLQYFEKDPPKEIDEPRTPDTE